jgi:predicted short-subunit dehydrogenase-like oxidoreductase (DUF2520 family)
MTVVPEDQTGLTVSIVGVGRLGASLAAALAAAGYAPPLLVGQGRRDSNGAGRSMVETPPDTLTARCDLIFLTVPDSAIADVAAAYPWRAGQVVVHSSGALGLDALASASALGASVGCFYPLQTFPARLPPEQASARFRGIVCGIEGSGEASNRLEAIAHDLGAHVVRLEGVERAAYHAAAVLAGNDVVALMIAAARAWAHAGLPSEGAREALAPLIRASADGIAELPLAQALTGPVARGDVSTVEQHLHALAGDPPLLELYRRLGLELLTLDLGHEPEVRLALQRALGG